MAKNENTKAASETKAEVSVTEEASTTGGAPKETSIPKIEETKVPENKSETVEVSKDDLAAFMKRLNDLEADNKKLLDVADKGRMFQHSEKERAADKKIPTVKISKLGRGGKTVIAWKMTKNESYVDGNRLIEHQEIEIFTQDGASTKMPLLEFYRVQNKETKGKVVGRSTDVEGVETIKVEMQDGSILEIGSKFVN